MSNILTNNINPRSGNTIAIGGVNDIVSIAGSISYDDVTNVDAIGIVTARGGLNVGPLTGIAFTVTSGGAVSAVGIATFTNRLDVGSVSGISKLYVSGTGNGATGSADVLSSMASASTILTRPNTGSAVGLALGARTGGGQYIQGLYGSSNVTAVRDISINPEGGNIAIGTYAAASTTAGQNIITFGTNLVERMRIDSSGRLLIGTTSSPTPSTVVIQGNSTGASSYGLVRLTRGTDSPADGESLGLVAFGDSNQASAAFVGCNRDGGTWTTGSSMPTRLVFNTTANAGSGSSERMRIDSAGKVYFGNFSDVANAGFIDKVTTGDKELNIVASRSTAVNRAIVFKGRSDTEAMRITGIGSMGIGTNDPLGELQVEAATQCSIICKTASSNMGKFASKGNDVYIAGTAGATNIIFKRNVVSNEHPADSGTETARIDSLGRLLIGTTSNFVRGYLQVIDNGGGEITIGRNDTTVSDGDDIGHLFFAGNDETGNGVVSANISAYAGANHTSTSYPTNLRFYTCAVDSTSPTERMRITDAGALLVPGVYSGTTATGANVVVEPDGTIRRSTSSIKYKNNVTTLTDDLADKILECRAVSYTSKCDGDDNAKINYGLIAEEVYDVDPSLVFTDNGEPEGVQYDRFVPHLVNLVKRQKTQIETLEQRLTDAGL